MKTFQDLYYQGGIMYNETRNHEQLVKVTSLLLIAFTLLAWTSYDSTNVGSSRRIAPTRPNTSVLFIDWKQGSG